MTEEEILYPGFDEAVKAAHRELDWLQERAVICALIQAAPILQKSMREKLTEATELLKEFSEENARLRAELKRLHKPSWKERLVAWLDTKPEGGGV